MAFATIGFPKGGSGGLGGPIPDESWLGNTSGVLAVPTAQPISTDVTLGGGGASDEVLSSQRAVKMYADGIALTTPPTVAVLGRQLWK